MKRDMDLVRELLLRIEALPIGPGRIVGIGLDQPELTVKEFPTEDIEHHLRFLMNGGLLDGHFTMNGLLQTKGLTWAGQDFLDKVRDDETWTWTKGAAKRAGGFSLELLGNLATAYIKDRAAKLFGMPL